MTSSSLASRTAPQAAVTSIFTPPSFCGGYIDASSWLTSPSSLSSCLPNFNLGVGWYDEAYYSPAICPSGYSAGCTRFNDEWQGPPLISGETAIICCPRSFKCVPYEDFGCVSGPKSSSTVALSVQIRWQSSDLSLFETPPLPTGLPTTSRHSGWDPESSLTYPYTFPPNCSTVTDLWLPYDQKTCQPLTGDYYSPAICPSGWTAAFTRPVTAYGPPVEADETAMLCCPSGMTRLEPACSIACVSATITSGGSMTTSLSIGLIEVRDPIEIRWASSDLSVFQTHPLTPGLWLNHPTVTVNPIPPPEGLYKAGLGLAFAPFAVVISFAATFGTLSLFWKRRAPTGWNAQTSMSAGTAFKPGIFSWVVSLLLLAFVLSAIILLELSCHILPATNSNIQLRDFEIIETHILETIEVVHEEVNTTESTPFNMSCAVTGTYSISLVSTMDHGTPTTLTKTWGTTACSISGSLVALPSCIEPATAPPGNKWLSEASQGGNQMIKLKGSVGEAFFLAEMLPTFVGAIFGIPWKVMHLHAATLEPFHQMTRKRGSTISSSIFGKFGGFHSIRAPMTLLTAGLVYSSAAITALASEAWGLSLIGTCAENDNNGCVPIVYVTPGVVHAMEGVLILIALFATALAFVTRRWSTGVLADPRSILGIATLTQSFGLRNTFNRLDPKSPPKDIIRQIGDMKVHFGTDLRQSESAQTDYGILLSEQTNPTIRNKEPMHTYNRELNSGNLGMMPIARVVLLLSGFAILLSGLTALIIYYIITDNNTKFEHFMSSQNFGPRFIFTVFGIIANFGWVAVLKVVLQLAPYYSMSAGRARASTSIIQPYSTDQYSGFIYSLRRGSPLLFSVTLPTILSDFLPLLLANVPFRRTTTWNAHIICSWAAVGALSLMIVALIGLTLVLTFFRPKWFISGSLLRNAPVAGTLLILSRSDDFMMQCRNLSTLKTSERNKRVRELGWRYSLASNVDGQVIVPRIRSVSTS